MSTAELRAGVESTAPVFAALGDPTRLRLVTRLSDGRARSITELSDGMAVSRQAVTKHLRVLEEVGVVHSKRIGRKSQFEFAPRGIDPANAFLAHVSSQWDEAIERLVAHVEGPETS